MQKGSSKLGTATIEPAGPVTAGAYGTWTITYTAGEEGIAERGELRVNLRHVQDMGAPQISDPKAAGYLSLRCSGKAKPEFVDRRGRWMPWQQGFAVRMAQAPLLPGETITLVLGDTSAGSPGIRLQTFAEASFEFRISADALGNGYHRLLDESPAIEIRGGPPVTARVFAPSMAVAGEPFRAAVKLEDRWGNPSRMFEGNIRLEGEDGACWGSACTRRFQHGEYGAHVFENLVAPAARAAAHYLVVRNGDGVMGRSHAIRCLAAAPERRVFWGDLHGHTELGDGTGSVDDYYRYARDVARLDFCAASEEDYLFTDASWVRFIEAARQYHEPGRFVTFLGYEWSGKVPGDHNVYYLDDTGPLFRSSTKYVGKTEYLELHNEGESHPLCRENAVLLEIADLYKALKGKRAMIIPHVGGNKTHLRFHDPELEPAIEMHSVHGSFEWFAMEALQRGYKVGLIGGGDSHDGRPGDAHTGFHFAKEHNGLMGVYAPELTREAIWDAIFARRVYATSGERILLDFSMNEHPMGARALLENPRTERQFRIYAAGLENIARIHLIKNNTELASWSPATREAAVDYADSGQDNPCDFYYVRVTQTDRAKAWSSPIWVASRPEELHRPIRLMSY
ncbi:MAG: DUF3604 domain-containing protein [Kiritimatiellae bacterium]|nr:DUF3604 domain-containing protein [Kiritimatiellia bacterium]